MEVTLKNAFQSFKNNHPDIEISQRVFKKLQPKNICLHRYAQRLQGCCTYHTNIDYIHKAYNNLFAKSGKKIPFHDNDALMSATITTQLHYVNLLHM